MHDDDFTNLTVIKEDPRQSQEKSSSGKIGFNLVDALTRETIHTRKKNQ